MEMLSAWAGHLQQAHHGLFNPWVYTWICKCLFFGGILIASFLGCVGIKLMKCYAASLYILNHFIRTRLCSFKPQAKPGQSLPAISGVPAGQANKPDDFMTQPQPHQLLPHEFQTIPIHSRYASHPLISHQTGTVSRSDPLAARMHSGSEQRQEVSNF